MVGGHDNGTGGVKAKPSGRPTAGLDPTSHVATRGPESAALLKPVLPDEEGASPIGGLVVPVQDVGIQVHAVRPGNRSGDVVDPDVAEDGRVAQVFENTTAEHWIEIELPDESVREGQPQLEALERNYCRDPRRPSHVQNAIARLSGGRRNFDPVLLLARWWHVRHPGVVERPGQEVPMEPGPIFERANKGEGSLLSRRSPNNARSA